MKIAKRALFVAALFMAKAFSADGGSVTQLQLITGNDGKKYFRIAHSVAVQIGSNVSSSQDYIPADEDPTYAALVWASLDRALHNPTIRVNIDGFSTTNNIDGTAWVCKLTRWNLTR